MGSKSGFQVLRGGLELYTSFKGNVSLVISGIVMISSVVVAVSLVLTSLSMAVLWLGLFPRWQKKFVTEARKREISAGERRRVRKKTKISLESAGQMIWFLLPLLLAVDGLLRKPILLYSPVLSFFNPLDTLMQFAGYVSLLLGIMIMGIVGYTLSKNVCSKAYDERKQITTGFHRSVRHPFYLSFILISVGIILVTLNLVAVLLLPAPFLGWSIEEEERGLLQKFGQDYRDYVKRTGKLFPKVRSR